MATPSNSEVFVKQIPAGGVATIDQPGKFFWVVTSPCEINIRSDDGQSFNPYNQGTGYDTEDNAQTFKRLTIQNPSSQAITVRIYAGFQRYLDTRQSVMPPPTRMAWKASSIPANSGITLTGIPPGGLDVRRAAVLLSNTETVLSAEVRDVPTGNIMLKLRPLDNISLPVSGPVQIYNPNGSPMQVHISEIFYTA